MGDKKQKLIKDFAHIRGELDKPVPERFLWRLGMQIERLTRSKGYDSGIMGKLLDIHNAEAERYRQYGINPWETYQSFLEKDPEGLYDIYEPEMRRRREQRALSRRGKN